MRNHLIAASIFSLALSIVIGSWLIADGMREEAQPVTVDVKEEKERVEKQLLTQAELAEYLGITEEEMFMMLPRTSDNVTSSSIPYVQIGTTYYFPKKAIDAWLLKTEAVVF
jgi:hypothetical protein